MYIFTCSVSLSRCTVCRSDGGVWFVACTHDLYSKKNKVAYTVVCACTCSIGYLCVVRHNDYLLSCVSEEMIEHLQ